MPLIFSAISIAFIHTILGPDHYLPFIAMSKVGQWTKNKTLLVAFVAGIGHILSSILIGFIGIFAGSTLNNLIEIESVRATYAQWFLLFFGIGYSIFGVYKILQNNHHHHFHSHTDGIVHTHSHHHDLTKHEHQHRNNKNKNLTPWILFTIFIFGPCEPLIPLLIYPAAKFGLMEAVLISSIFGIVTISTLMGIVYLGIKGVEIFKFHKIEKYQHLLAGVVLIFSALATFLGL